MLKYGTVPISKIHNIGTLIFNNIILKLEFGMYVKKNDRYRESVLIVSMAWTESTVGCMPFYQYPFSYRHKRGKNSVVCAF